MSLPTSAPAFRDLDQLITVAIDRRSFDIPLNELETLLSPTLFLLPGRAGVIVPIRRTFADLLFGTSPQMSFLAGAEAILFRQRAYFSDLRTERVIRPGMPILFYESAKGAGRGAVVAAARVVQTESVWKEEIAEAIERRGVLETAALKRMGRGSFILATTFDNIMRLQAPVSLKKLRTLGCVDRANLITARRVQPSNSLQFCAKAKRMLGTEDILISLHARHVQSLLAGEKSVELRRRSMHLTPASRVWIYGTRPIGRMEALGIVNRVERLPPPRDLARIRY